MAARLDLAAIAARVDAQTTGVTCTTSLKRNFLTDFGRVYPAVWVRSQRLTPLDDGDGYAGFFRQHCSVDIALTIVVQRYQTNSYDAETALQALHDSVDAALLNWQPTGADTPFTFGGDLDGDEAESVACRHLVYRATLTKADT